MADQEQDVEDDFTVIEIDEQERRATVNVDASWQEYEDRIEFCFTAGKAEINVVIPDDEEYLVTQALISSLPQAFATALAAFFEAQEVPTDG